MSVSKQIDAKLLKEQIPFIKECREITQIHEGYSTDQKFIVSKIDGQKFLLRIFDLSQFESKQSEYHVLQKMDEYAVKCSRPVEIGKLRTLGKGYMLLTFIEGLAAAKELPNYSEAEQFQLGVDAGKQLLKMHQFQAPIDVLPWYDRKLEKNKRYIDEYAKSGVEVKNDTKIITFIEKNIALMKHRPNLFQHDDFHVANIVVNEKKLVGIIDFERYDWGDPIHEFLKVGMFSREISIPFSIGQITGYHNNNEPEELFWRLYSLYLAMCVFSSIVWILKMKPDELNQMLDKVNTVLEDHQYFEKLKPFWYAEGLKL